MDIKVISKELIENKRVLVRGDLDVGKDVLEGKDRLKTLIETLIFLADNKAKITIIGHRGRPEGKVNKSLSLKPVSRILEELLKEKLGAEKMENLDMQMRENLRFEKGEEENDKGFAESLCKDQDVFVNEAFAVSHRKHASIIGIPKILPSAIGFHFEKEINALKKVLENPKKPVVFVIGGKKEDKITYLEALSKKADMVLVAGRLPEYIYDSSPLRKNEKIIISNLLPDREDITINSIEAIEKEIQKAQTIVLNGPMGRFEDETHRQGTKRVYEAIKESDAFKVAGGGETENALDEFKMLGEFDWISSGGGAMLEFLSSGTLPGIEAISD